jgi:hypothetical protein
MITMRHHNLEVELLSVWSPISAWPAVTVFFAALMPLPAPTPHVMTKIHINALTMRVYFNNPMSKQDHYHITHQGLSHRTNFHAEFQSCPWCYPAHL